jgi:hypothetical protein
MTRAAKPPSNKRKSLPLDVESLLFAHAGPACVLDLQGHILAANSPALQLIKPANSSAWQGQPFTQYLTAESQTAWSNLLGELQADRRDVRATLTVINPAGAACPIELAARPVVRGRRIAAMQVVMRPIDSAPRSGLALAPAADRLQRIVTVLNVRPRSASRLIWKSHQQPGQGAEVVGMEAGAISLVDGRYKNWLFGCIAAGGSGTWPITCASNWQSCPGWP